MKGITVEAIEIRKLKRPVSLKMSPNGIYYGLAADRQEYCFTK